MALRMFEHGLKTQFSIYATLTPNLVGLGVLLLLTVIIWARGKSARNVTSPPLF